MRDIRRAFSRVRRSIILRLCLATALLLGLAGMHVLTAPTPASAAMTVSSAPSAHDDRGVTPLQPASLTRHATMAAPGNLIATAAPCCFVANGQQLWLSPALSASLVGSTSAAPARHTALTPVPKEPGDATGSHAVIPLRI